jgi:hypothetical protein
MAALPNKIEKFSDLEKDAFTSIAQANWTKAAQLLEYVNKSFPIGMLMFFHASQDGLPSQPDPQYWKFLDGTPVTNPLSPLFGVDLSALDFRGKFFKNPGTGQIELIEAGSNSVNLSHSHGGQTGHGSDWDSLRLDNGGERGQALGNHSHPIGGALGSTSTIPAHRELQVYMRIL